MTAIGRSGIRRTWRSWHQAQVVEVVRDLAGREVSCGLSAGEKRMLAKARLGRLVGNRPNRNQSVISSGPCTIAAIQVLC